MQVPEVVVVVVVVVVVAAEVDLFSRRRRRRRRRRVKPPCCYHPRIASAPQEPLHGKTQTQNLKTLNSLNPLYRSPFRTFKGP